MAGLDPRLYTVAWIAPLEIEAQAAMHMLDHRHPGHFPVSRGDDYVFQAGDVCGHNVVIATLPAGQEYGTGSAAALAGQIKKFFPNLWFGLLVGVAAGLPRLSGPRLRDIRLGDVLVALPEGDSAGLVAYDLGKETGTDGFQLLRFGHVLANTETVIRSAIGSIKLYAPDDAKIFLPYYEAMKHKKHANGTFTDPGQDQDRLFEADEAGTERIVRRDQRAQDRRTQVWYGPIGSGEKLLKDASKRSELRDRYGVIGLEMEAAGMMNRIPVGVIRGVCDYGDEHKNNNWQPYAAAMAAAYAKSVLNEIRPTPDQAGLSRQIQNPASNGNPYFYIPLKTNKNFVGRRHVICALMTKLFTQPHDSRVALWGLGGIGKTQVALQVASQTKEHDRNCSVFWASAVNIASYEQACNEIMKVAAIQGDKDENAKETVRRYLNSTQSGRWLLIVDNADDGDVIFGTSEQLGGCVDFLPSSDEGRILFTSRSRKVAVQLAGGGAICLEKLAPDEAMQYLAASLTQDSLGDMAKAAKLLDKLLYLPLAITQAVAYIAANGISVGEYLQLFENTDQDQIELLSSSFRDETRYAESQNAIATTWLISFHQISKTDKCASNLLRFIAFIEPKAIPQSILPWQGTEQRMTAAIGSLTGHGFLERRESRSTFDMHNLVHLATRVWIEKENNVVSCQLVVLTRLANVFPTHDWENRDLWRQYLPHALRVLRIRADKVERAYCDLGHWVGYCLSADGRIKEAIKVLEQVAALRTETLGESHPDKLASQHALAIVYEANGQAKEAVKLLEQVVAIYDETLEQSDPNRLASQHELAVAYRSNGQAREALRLLKKVVAIEETTLDESHPGRLTSQHALALAYEANGQAQKAIRLLKKVVAIREKTLEESHPDLLTSQHVLATSYQANGQAREALGLLKKVVAIREKILEESHPDLLTSQHALAVAYRSSGQAKEALGLLKQVDAFEEATLEESHPHRLITQHELAIAYEANGQVKEAIELLKKVVAIGEKTLEESHQDLLASQHELALIYAANGQAGEALVLLKKVVAIGEKTLEEGHPYRLVLQRALASVYEANRQTEEATQSLRQRAATE